KAARDRFLEPLGNLDKGCGIVARNEVARRLIAEKGVISEVEMMALHGSCRRREGEHVVDGRSDFEGALIAMALDAGDPFRIDHPRAPHAADLFLEGADNGPLGA